LNIRWSKQIVGNSPERNVTFARLPDISADEIIAHMSDPRVAEHMPLLTFKWDYEVVTKFQGPGIALIEGSQ